MLKATRMAPATSPVGCHAVNHYIIRCNLLHLVAPAATGNESRRAIGILTVAAGGFEPPTLRV